MTHPPRRPPAAAHGAIFTPWRIQKFGLNCGGIVANPRARDAERAGVRKRAVRTAAFIFLSRTTSYTVVVSLPSIRVPKKPLAHHADFDQNFGTSTIFHCGIYYMRNAYQVLITGTGRSSSQECMNACLFH